MLLIHGTKDPLVSPDQATLMHDRLKSAEVDTELLILEGAGHFIQEDAPDEIVNAIESWSPVA